MFFYELLLKFFLLGLLPTWPTAEVIAAVDPEKHWSTPGQVLGGGGAGAAVAASPEEMRRT